jgi:hypothetical protein
MTMGNIERQMLPLPVTPHCLAWKDDRLVNRGNGEQYYPEYDAHPPGRGLSRNVGYSFGGTFDRAIISSDGQYTLIYTNLGTKGLLLRGSHELIREVNRSYYCANAYEYPAVFATVGDRTYLVHCPLEYCRLDFEDVETGEIVTMHPDRKPLDFFHSRLEVSPGGRYLVSKGWVWHPLDAIAYYDIAECLANPRLLDASPMVELEEFGIEGAIDQGELMEFGTGSFIDDDLLLVGKTEGGAEAAFWDLRSRKIVHRIKIEGPYGNLLAIDEHWAWDLYQHPKVIDLTTGKIEWISEDIFSGEQNSSIIGSRVLPPVAWSRRLGKLAIGGENKVEVLRWVG